MNAVVSELRQRAAVQVIEAGLKVKAGLVRVDILVRHMVDYVLGYLFIVELVLYSSIL